MCLSGVSVPRNEFKLISPGLNLWLVTNEISKLFLFIFSKIVTVLFMSNVMSVPNGSSLNLTVLKHFETTLEIQTALECLKVAAQLKSRF